MHSSISNRVLGPEEHPVACGPHKCYHVSQTSVCIAVHTVISGHS